MGATDYFDTFEENGLQKKSTVGFGMVSRMMPVVLH
jgi:hypothetical protein